MVNLDDIFGLCKKAHWQNGKVAFCFVEKKKQKQKKVNTAAFFCVGKKKK